MSSKQYYRKNETRKGNLISLNHIKKLSNISFLRIKDSFLFYVFFKLYSNPFKIELIEIIQFRVEVK